MANTKKPINKVIKPIKKIEKKVIKIINMVKTIKINGIKITGIVNNGKITTSEGVTYAYSPSLWGWVGN